MIADLITAFAALTLAAALGAALLKRNARRLNDDHR